MYVYTQNVGQNKFICTNCELSREKCSPMAAFGVLVSKARTNLYILHVYIFILIKPTYISGTKI